MIKLFIKIDDFFGKLHEKISKWFFGKAFLKLSGEIVLALLVALAVYLGSSAYENSKIESIENENLNKLYISVSIDYVESLFGEPYIKIQESDSLQSQFYLLKDAVLRTVTENDTVVAFFITSKDEHRKISISTFYSGKRTIGKTNYFKVDFANPKIDSNLETNDRYCYYEEIQGTGRYAMYNYYLFATVSYGFVDDESVRLSEMYSTNSSASKENTDPLRKKAKPNTFGVIADGYEETVTLIPKVDEWQNIYYLLTK